MIPHGQAEMLDLAGRATSDGASTSNGWTVDWWFLDEKDVEVLVALYRAVLMSDVEAEMAQLLMAEGVMLEDILLVENGKSDKITRSDATELAAAASLVGIDSWPTHSLYMPNVPKMARKKSDSGIDVMAVSLNETEEDHLEADEQLYLASVKHTVDTVVSGLKSKLLASVGDQELSLCYVGNQLRVLHGDLLKKGHPKRVVDRIFHFLRHLKDSKHVHVHAIAVIDTDVAHLMKNEIDRLSETQVARSLRVVVIPGLKDLHSRCA